MGDGVPLFIDPFAVSLSRELPFWLIGENRALKAWSGESRGEVVVLPPSRALLTSGKLLFVPVDSNEETDGRFKP